MGPGFKSKQKLSHSPDKAARSNVLMITTGRSSLEAKLTSLSELKVVGPSVSVLGNVLIFKCSSTELETAKETAGIKQRRNQF